MEHRFEVKAFGMIAEKIGTDSIQVVGIETIDELKSYLTMLFPNLKGMKFSIALDKKIIQNTCAIPSGSEVALLPPFSGG
jgi:molybdopterin synthase sulfur carrier subunit